MARRTTIRRQHRPQTSDGLSQRVNKPSPQPQPAPAAPKPQPAPKPPMPTRTTDSHYTAGMAGLNLQYGNTIEDIIQQRNRTSFDTGYGADGAVDPRNAYSQAMLLQRRWQQNRAGASISMANRGQLYSGARRAALRNEDFDYQRGSADLQEATRRQYEDLSIAEQRAGLTRNVGEQQLAADQATRWQDAEREWYTNYG